MPAIMMADPGSMGTNMGPRHSQPNLVPGPDMRQHAQDLENLTAMLTAWNANRLDLFALSMPNEVSDNVRVSEMNHQQSSLTENQIFCLIWSSKSNFFSRVFHFLWRLQAERDMSVTLCGVTAPEQPEQLN